MIEKSTCFDDRCFLHIMMSAIRFLELQKQLVKNLRRKTMVLEACKQVNFMTTATLRA